MLQLMKRNISISLSSPIFWTGMLSVIFCLLGSSLFAQRDSVHGQTIEITSAYKPELRNSVKIDLHATPLTPDTSRPRMAYSIPAQNLFFSYQPVTLKPLTMQSDEQLELGTRNFVKAGFGNLTTPYISGALGFGDGKESLASIFGSYISSRGKIKNQDFSEINLKGTGSLFSNNHETYAFLGFSQHEYYQYGYDHSQHTYDKSDLRRSYRDLSLGLGFRNTEENDIGINYNPHIELHAFTRQNKVNESTLSINLPAEKKVGEFVTVKVEGVAKVNGYKINAQNLQITNSLFQLAPEVVYKNDRFKLHGGITPSWNNGTLSILPNIYGEVQLQDNILAVQGGWVGRFHTNSFRSLSMENPYIQDPVFFFNTKEVEYYGGIKASVGGHLNLNAKAAFIQYTDKPLFVNDNFDQKSFLVVNESRINNFQIHGDLNYINQDKFTVTGALDLNTYTGLKDNTQAWGLYPLKVTGSLRWYAFDQLLVKGDLVAFSGAKALTAGGSSKNMKGGTDLSAGGEYKINRMFSAWLDFDNLLNSKYQRWNRYPVYGFQVLGGVIVRF